MGAQCNTMAVYGCLWLSKTSCRSKDAYSLLLLLLLRAELTTPTPTTCASPSGEQAWHQARAAVKHAWTLRNLPDAGQSWSIARC